MENYSSPAARPECKKTGDVGGEGTSQAVVDLVRTVPSRRHLESLRFSHRGHHELFDPATCWIETPAHPKTIFDLDRNRRLHFEEGFLTACRRVYKDTSINYISEHDHFPYRDLEKFRTSTKRVFDAYREGNLLPPPLFFYSAPYQLEILDGVHRCLAAYDVVDADDVASSDFTGSYRIWVGFRGDHFSAEVVAQQIWRCSQSYVGS